jgi:serine protease
MRSRFFTVPIVLFGVLLATALTGCSDESPPAVAEVISLSPTAIDTSESGQAVDLAVRLTDDFSGVGSATAYLSLPSTGINYNSGRLQLVSGTGRDGVYEGTIQVPQHAPPGTYQLHVSIQDKVERTSDTYPGPTVEVAGSDALSPQVADVLSLSPTTIDTSTSGGSVDVKIRLTDDVSGVGYAVAYLSLASAGINYNSPRLTLTSGTILDGVYQGTIEVPQYAPPGTYRLRVSIQDRVERTTTSYPGPTVEMTGGDTAPPAVAEVLSLSPATVDTSTSGQSVDVSVRLTDDLSGIATATAYLSLPSAGINYNSPRLALASGTDLDGTYEGTIALPRFAPAGTYLLRISIQDRVEHITTTDPGPTVLVS